LSNLDPLTKIYNRRGFTYTANKQFKSFQETQKTFSIVLFDIDYFKRINDGFGHDAGDEILVWVTNKIKALLSADDLLGRWGGEEFIALLPGRDLNEAAKMADQIRKAINKKPIDVLGNSINVSISGGVAEMKVGSSIDSCIKKADLLLYQAKQNGRNQICSKLD
jgi:diguanylate cyclase (GGDEF)-like protein